MKKPRLVTGFSRYRDTALEVKARTILSSLTDNAHFANPIPSLAELKEATDSYSTALGEAENGGKRETATKNELRQQLEELLNRISLYVVLIAGVDELRLISSGFSLAKAELPIGMLPKPENFMAKTPEKGMIGLSLDPIHGAHSYQFEYRQTGASEWNVAISSKSTLRLTGLSNGTCYEFRVFAIGTAPERVYSNEIQSFILQRGKGKHIAGTRPYMVALTP